MSDRRTSNIGRDRTQYYRWQDSRLAPRSISAKNDDEGHVTTRLHTDALYACAAICFRRFRSSPSVRRQVKSRSSWPNGCPVVFVAVTENVRKVQGIYQRGGAAAAGLLQERVDEILGTVLRQCFHRLGDTDLVVLENTFDRSILQLDLFRTGYVGEHICPCLGI
ncbi:uncharacterized protein LOC143904809 isoform X2 [Temnothorax americanus]|uniref:uncharacterized protein LOC143904809 isoform X2 n=1 Tax=Temnothorax americanus TaxID=1964332 RepID=UPI0040687F32